MRRALLFFFSIGCGGGFDAKSAAEGHRIEPEEKQPTAPKSAIAREVFATAAVAFDVDVFAREPTVTMPMEAHMTLGTFLASQNIGPGQDLKYGGHTCEIAFAGGWDRFDAEIAPKLISGVDVPNGTALLFALEKGSYKAVLVRTPPILSTAEAVSGSVGTWPHVEIDLNNGQTTKRDIPTVTITLTKGGTDKLAAFIEANPGRPMAHIARGRVVETTPAPPKIGDAPWPPRIETVLLKLDGQTTADAEAVARALQR